jgi:hypothetical protein
MMDSGPRTVTLRSRMTQPSHFHSSTESMRLTLCGMRTIPTLLYRVVTTAYTDEDSVLRTEMVRLESQEEDDPR